jgi:hypothetical protein
MELDVRWHQRFDNYNKALLKFEQAIDYIKKSLPRKYIRRIEF